MTDAASSPAANPTARRRGLTLIAAAVALVGIGWGGWHWLQGRHHQTTDNAYVAGNVVQITPQVGGTVVAILADDNDVVKAGQSLVKLDTADAKVALDQAEAQLAQTVREVKTMYAGNATLKAQVALREIAAGCGPSYESLSKDYSQSNYSSSRLALLDDRDLYKAMQQWWIRAFRMPLHKVWLQQAVLAGAIEGVSPSAYALNPEKFAAVLFKPRGWSWVDPTKEVAAYKEAIKAGLTTLTDVIAATGGGMDIEDVVATRRREIQMLDEAGIEVDTTVQDPMALAEAAKPDPAAPRETTDDDEAQRALVTATVAGREAERTAHSLLVLEREITAAKAAASTNAAAVCTLDSKLERVGAALQETAIKHADHAGRVAAQYQAAQAVSQVTLDRIQALDLRLDRYSLLSTGSQTAVGPSEDSGITIGSASSSSSESASEAPSLNAIAELRSSSMKSGGSPAKRVLPMAASMGDSTSDGQP